MAGSRQKLEQAIQAQENLRGLVDDAVIDAALSSLYQQLKAQEIAEQAQQRKQVTLIFVDVVGSTRIVRDMDPEENLALMDTALQRLAIPVAQHGGRVTRFMGDGFKAVFGLPKARENDPEMAVRAGLGILETAQQLAQELDLEQGISNFQVRVGVNTGLVASGGQTEAESTIMGRPVNLAARIESAAPPGSMLISQFTRQHVRGLFELKPLQPVQAKGFTDPVPVYLVLGVKATGFWQTRRGVEGVETPMIGRDAQLQILQDRYRSTLQNNRCHWVMVSGDAGLGKSRLLLEFAAWINRQPETFTLYYGRARLENRKFPYGLLRDLFNNHFAVHVDDPAQIVREKILIGFQEVWGDGEAAAMKSHIIGQFLGFDFHASPHLVGIHGDPQQLHDRALIYLAGYFQAVARESPILLFFEDLHWADDSSLEVIIRLFSQPADRPFLLVTTARPVFFEGRSDWGLDPKFYRQVDLQPLSRENTVCLVAEVLSKAADIPPDLRDLVVSNAAGNPFYVEELLKMLIADGVILKTEPRWQVRLDRLAEAHVPPTLTGVLQARLDSLASEERALLQQAAVIGRVFWDILLVYLNRRTESLHAEFVIAEVLDKLQNKELIFLHGTSTFGGAREHIFKHAILHEVTYESVLKRLRQTYHALVAEWLKQQGEQRSSHVNGLIADHLRLAGQHQEAFAFYGRASEAAGQVYANEEAITYLQEAIALLPNLVHVEDKTAALYEQLGDLQGIIGRFELAKNAYSRAKLNVSDPIDLSRLHRKVSHLQLIRKEQDMASQTLDKAEALIGTPDSPVVAAQWQEWLELKLDRLWLYYWRRDTKHMEQLADEIIPAINTYGTNLQKGIFFQRLVLLSLQRDRFVVDQETIAYAQQSLAAIKESGKLRQIAIAHFVYGFASLWQGFRGDLAAAEEYLQAGLQQCQKIGDIVWQCRCLSYLPVVYRKQGLVEAARAMMPRVIAISEQHKVLEYIAYARGNLAWIAWYDGDLAQAQLHGEAGQEAQQRFEQQAGAQMPFRWISLWPLLAVYVAQDQLNLAIKCVRSLIEPQQMLLPVEISSIFDQALFAWTNGDEDAVRSNLRASLGQARLFNYL